MASIFTFDPDPPRVSSPWSTPPPGSQASSRIPQDAKPPPSQLRANGDQGSSNVPSIDYSTITRLEAEPQEGPTEYKLHLLLRRRRSFTRTSTGRHISGSLRRAEIPTPAPVSRSVSESGLLLNTPPALSSTQSRQHRLEQLTTQLLWRLQQSCPYHISSSTAPVLPHFPDEAQLTTPVMPQRLLPGLEESKGALYEIGVADDGTFVGLAEDEMEESLNNLRAMAASLGCRVEVQRMVSVGDCEWVANTPQQKIQTSKLLVAEALVRPDQHLVNHSKVTQKDVKDGHQSPATNISLPELATGEFDWAAQQLRVSLTGLTMSGKSSLLGSLSTATLDNGRGKSRLSLLKHRHEIASGMTSSVTQELIGYTDVVDHEGNRTSTQVISYGSSDISSWVDIHAAAEAAGNDGRLVFLSDSAGHPRFRRTTVRTLVGWSPHWTLLCIAADNTDDSSGRIGASPSSQEILGPTAAELDLSQTHLQLCLNLELPLVVVITKYDLATKAGLRQTLSKLLSALKDAGRKPCIISDPSMSVSEVDIDSVSANDLLEAEGIVESLKATPLATVPIIFTSAVKGTGIKKLHAFLRELPVPPITPLLPRDGPRTLFYVEDFYSVLTRPRSSDQSAIIGGHVRCGQLTVGDELVLGPYPVDTSSDDSDSGSGIRSTSNSPVPVPRSFPGALHKSDSRRTALRPGSAVHASEKHTEWRHVRITSLRNLRLPVRTLQSGQVGTVGVVPLGGPRISPALNRIRKGMVLANHGEPRANRVISVRFTGANAQAAKNLSVGSAVVVYVASVRASSKVVSVTTENNSHGNDTVLTSLEDEDDGFGFGFDEDLIDDRTEPTVTSTTIAFQFIASREFVELDAKVLVLPGGGPGLSGGTERGEKGVAGLEGYVGRVIEGY